MNKQICYLTLFYLCFNALYLTSPIETIIHENLHCKGCNIVYDYCNCTFNYNFYSFSKMSSVTYRFSKEKTCIYDFLGNSSNIIINFLPYFSFLTYTFFSIIMCFILKNYFFNLYLYFFFNIITIINTFVLFFLYISQYYIQDFQNIIKTNGFWTFLHLYFSIIYFNIIPTIALYIFEIKNMNTFTIIHKIKKRSKNNIIKTLYKIFNSNSYELLETENEDIVDLLFDNFYDADNKYRKLYLVYLKSCFLQINILANFFLTYLFIILYISSKCIHIYNLAIFYLIFLGIRGYVCYYQHLYIKSNLLNYYFFLFELLPFIFINIYAGIYYYIIISFIKTFCILYYIKL
jgi:hypothetical protein